MKKYTFALVFALIAFSIHVSAQEKLVDRVVATVGSNIILQSDIDMQYAQSLAQGMKADESFKCYILQQLLTQKLLVQQAAIDSIEISESEVDDELNRRMRYMTQQAGGKERLETFLNRSLLQYKEEMRPNVAEQLRAQSMQSNIVQKIDVTPLEVKRYFESLDQDSLPYFNTEVEIGEIVVEPELTKEEKNKFREKADGYRQQILNGSDFGTIARLYSEDGSSTFGGELDFATRDAYVKEFSAQAFRLKEGEISEVFETQYGFHFLQVLERRGEEVKVRHILIKSKPTPASLDRAKAKIDSIYDRVVAGDIPFHTAASIYSDNKETKFNGGMVLNEHAEVRTTTIPVDQLDASTFTAIDPLKEGEYSKPYLFTDRTGDTAYKFNFLKTRIAPHQANMDQDFAKIKEAATQDKINRKLSEWFESRRENTYIHINEDFGNCEDLKIWLKEDQELLSSK